MKRDQLKQGCEYVVRTDGKERIYMFSRSEVRPRAQGRPDKTVYVCYNTRGKITIVNSLDKFIREWS